MLHRPLVLALLVALGLGLASCSGGTQPVEPSLGDNPEQCDNGRDDNADGKTDCADPQCFGLPVCILPATPQPERCDVTGDEDGDGKADCADSDCASLPACSPPTPTAELCTGGLDEDDDGKVDCADSDCTGNAACAPTTGPEVCTGGQDEDADGEIDCADVDCAQASACASAAQETTQAACQNGVDDDHDGRTDCQDTGCAGRACGTGCQCQAGGRHELACGDNFDNDGDGQKDCADSDCAGGSCGTGCTCAPTGPKEQSCSDGLDNDGDLYKDCTDSDCAQASNCLVTENCGNDTDDDGDRAVDCADADCGSSNLCKNLQDGRPCSANGQCAGGKCDTETATGNPNGACTNSVSCNPVTQSGCNGGLCVEAGTFDICRMRCTGTGTGTTGRCRPGYACLDLDANPSNNNNFCVALCTQDSQCANPLSQGNYGCNPWSKFCEVKDLGLKKYGETCTSDAQCEGAFCDTSKPGGYCTGFCDGTTLACGPGGTCGYDSAYGDNIGYCFDSCANTSDCRGTPYTCQSASGGGACWCRANSESCTSGTQCCSGACSTTAGCY